MSKDVFYSAIKICVFLSFGLLTAVTHADPNAVCDDLERLACTPGQYDDGTGKASNGTVADNANDTIKQQNLKIARERFGKSLQDPSNSYFRKAVLSATGLSLVPQCDGAEDKPSAACLNLLADGVSDIFAKQQYGSSGAGRFTPYGSGSNISDKTYVTDSPIFKSIRDEILGKVRKGLGEDAVNQKAGQKVFPQVKQLLLKQIDLLVKDPATRKMLTDKVSSIRYQGSDCSKDFGSGETIPGLMITNAFYSPTQNTFKFCTGMDISNSSEFQMAFVIAHELAHSIDPCGITLGPKDFSFHYKPDDTRAQAEAEFPFPGVVGCLRSNKSVQAKPSVQTNAYSIGSNGAVGMYGSSPVQPDKFKSFCERDQITESFADWMAAEITPQYIDKNFPRLAAQQLRFGYSNIWRGMCNDSPAYADSGDPHPAQVDRTNKIILVQPLIRSQMKCSKSLPETVYCAVGDPHAPPSVVPVSPSTAKAVK